VNPTKVNLEKLNIQIQFSDSGRSAPRGRGGFRGGRGGFGESRGPRAERGGRGGNRGGRGGARMDNKVQAPQINDDEFPSLGGGRWATQPPKDC